MSHFFSKMASWAVYDQALVSGANFLSTLLVARMVAPESFAMFSLASITILFLSSFHRTLITQPMNALGAIEAPRDLAGRFACLLSLHLPLIAISVVFLAGIGLFFFPQVGLIIGAATYLATFFLQEVVRRYYYTQSRIQSALFNDLISYGGQLVILFAMYIGGITDPAYAFVALAATSFLAFLAGVGPIKKEHAALGACVTEKKTLLLEHWKFAKWIVLSQFVFWGATQIYPFMLAEQTSYSAVADFNIANSILNALNVVRLMLGNYLPSRVTQIFTQGGVGSLQPYLLRVLAYSCGSAIVFIGLLLVCSDWLVNMLFADKYPLAGSLIGWLAIAHFATIIGVVTNAGALALRTTNWIFIANAVGTVFALAVGPWLISQFGVWGAVAALAVSSSLPPIIQGGQLAIKCLAMRAKEMQ